MKRCALVRGLAAQQNDETLDLITDNIGGAGSVRALVFDIDGTLTQTNRVDGEFFKRSIQAVLPDVELESFADFVEMTDSAILRDICAEQAIAEYESVEEAVRTHFVQGLISAMSVDPGSFSAVPGAQSVFSVVRRAGWVPAIATGGWRPSAELKLNAADIPTSGVPMATSSEADRRVDIIRLAVSAAGGGFEASQVVYVGDGTWDARACRELGIGFIGRAKDGDRERLEEVGAKVIVPDFTDPRVLLDALSRSDHLRLAADEV